MRVRPQYDFSNLGLFLFLRKLKVDILIFLSIFLSNRLLFLGPLFLGTRPG
jgi:hypothetical protein